MEMSLSLNPDTADHTLHPRHNGVCPPCPAERAVAADAYNSYERAREAFLLAAEALGAAAKDAGVALDSRCCPADTHIRLFLACVTENADDLIDADALAELKKTGRC